jgi:hypothetical protein
MSRDLHIQLIDPSLQTARALFTLGPAPIDVDGVQKLANRWLKLFMTPKGSHPYRKEEGTLFPSLVSGNVADLASVEGDVLEAIDDATDQLRASDRRAPTRPPNERILTVTLVQFVELPPAGIEFWVELTNVARERLPLLLPYAPG